MKWSKRKFRVALRNYRDEQIFALFAGITLGIALIKLFT